MRNLENIMKNPIVAQKSPYRVELTAGRKYYWCACGRSANQPFCDGKHKAYPGQTPVEYIPETTETAYLCGCKATAQRPHCDGSHNSL